MRVTNIRHQGTPGRHNGSRPAHPEPSPLSMRLVPWGSSLPSKPLRPPSPPQGPLTSTSPTCHSFPIPQHLGLCPLISRPEVHLAPYLRGHSSWWSHGGDNLARLVYQTSPRPHSQGSCRPCLEIRKYDAYKLFFLLRCFGYSRSSFSVL